jgi:hypothetical protein
VFAYLLIDPSPQNALLTKLYVLLQYLF